MMKTKEAQTRLSKLVLSYPARIMTDVSVSRCRYLQTWYMGLEELSQWCFPVVLP